MSIESITTEEFERGFGLPIVYGKRPNPETCAVLQLQVGEAIKFPCRWRHNRYCFGAGMASRSSVKYSQVVKTRCVDKIIYVMRLS